MINIEQNAKLFTILLCGLCGSRGLRSEPFDIDPGEPPVGPPILRSVIRLLRLSIANPRLGPNLKQKLFHLINYPTSSFTFRSAQKKYQHTVILRKWWHWLGYSFGS